MDFLVNCEVHYANTGEHKHEIECFVFDPFVFFVSFVVKSLCYKSLALAPDSRAHCEQAAFPASLDLQYTC